MTFVFDLAGKQRGKVVHRAALLGELLKLIPKEKMHTNKKLTRIEDLGNPRVLLHFGDNTTFEADAVIGADGVHGNVRQYVLGVHHPALKPKSAGFWDSRSLITITKAKELLGAKFFEEQRQYGWVGDGGFFMHDVLDGGETVQCVVCGLTDESWEGDEKMKNLDNTTLQQALSSWTETTIKKGMIEVCVT
jgi:salicylate hydroxylase